jgi:ribosomal protein S11
MILSKTLGLLKKRFVIRKSINLRNVNKSILIFKDLKRLKKIKPLTTTSISLNSTGKLQKKKILQELDVNRSGELINYVIHVNLSLTNTYVSVTDVKGRLLISLSAGAVGLKKRQKRTQPLAVVSVFKELFLKTKNLDKKKVSIHFHNVKFYYESLVIKLLKPRVFIKTVRSYNLHPHNGCRPKKLKRFKQRTKR